MRRLLVLLAALLAATLISATGAQAAAPAPSGDALRFDLQAGSGTLTRVAGSTTRYQLTLRRVAPQTTWSSDAPTTNGGSIGTGRLVSLWKKLGLAKTPPQAVLALLAGRRSADAFALELRAPAYDAKRRTLRLKVVTKPSPPARLAFFGPQIDRPRSVRFGQAALLVDNGYVEPVGAGRDEPVCNYIGQVEQFPPGTFTDAYLPADGRSLPLGHDTYALYALIGDRFGGDGRTTFKLPTVAAAPGLQQRVCINGTFPTRDEGSTDVEASCSAGSVVLNAGSYVPAGWTPADGRALNRNWYRTLYDAIGTRFGTEGEDGFRVPDVKASDGLRYLVCTNGERPNPQAYGQTCTVGQFTLFATPGLPSTYVPADGRVLGIRENPELFSVLGAGFGGDGQTTFATPNLPSPVAGTAWAVCGTGTYPH